jgi:hypothetical protein
MKEQELAETLKGLGIGLSSLLRYSFGGFLLIALGLLVNPVGTNMRLEKVPWEVTAISAIALGAGIYAAHRSFGIFIHHRIGSALLYLRDYVKKVPQKESLSPTRWLVSLGVPGRFRFSAYTILRQSNLVAYEDNQKEEERKRWEQQNERWNIVHAENGLVVMLSEGLFAAGLYALKYPEHSWVKHEVLWFLFLLSFGASFPRALQQHTIECARFRTMKLGVKKLLRESGLLKDNNQSEAG